MRDYILLLPLIFIFHDMEEIIGFKRFLDKNPWVFERYPKITSAYRNFQTDAFAMAVYEEFIPFFGISLLTYFFPGKIIYAIWFGLLIALTVHFGIHIIQSICLKKYIPSFITSIICMPISIYIILKCLEYISLDLLVTAVIICSIIGMMLNLRLAHVLMHKFEI